MGAYNFQQRFTEFVLDGSKQHTIRGKRKHPDKPGSTFYGFTGMRTKNCVKLIEAPVVKVEEIVFKRARVWIAGEELQADEKDAFAWRDGFRFDNTAGRIELTGSGGCFDLMLQFWVDTRKTTEFEGDLIHWDWARRVHENIANSQPKLQRGQVWCLTCGATHTVDSRECLRNGWPKCCGQTMTIDSPEERKECAK
jgi:hypothetical protein